jgi:hypothetical protein
MGQEQSSGKSVALRRRSSVSAASSPDVLPHPEPPRRERSSSVVVTHEDSSLLKHFPQEQQQQAPAVSSTSAVLASLPRRVMLLLLGMLADADLIALGRTCRALHNVCFPRVDVAKLPAAPPVVYVETDVVAVAQQMRSNVASDEDHLSALRVLLTQATRFPRIRLASATFANPFARKMLEACGMEEEQPGYLSATTREAKLRLSLGVEMLEILVAQQEKGGEEVLGAMLERGAGSARSVPGARESVGRRAGHEDACAGDGLPLGGGAGRPRRPQRRAADGGAAAARAARERRRRARRAGPRARAGCPAPAQGRHHRRRRSGERGRHCRDLGGRLSRRPLLRGRRGLLFVVCCFVQL